MFGKRITNDPTRSAPVAGEFDRVASAAPVGLVEVDVNGVCTTVNRGWRDLTGRTAEQLRTESWLASVHPDDLGEVLVAWGHMAAGDTGFHMEFRLRRPDGSVVWVEGCAARIAGAGPGSGFALAAITLDQRQGTQERLQGAESHLCALRDTMDEAVVTVDAALAVQGVNPAAVSLFGWLPGEIIGRPLASLLTYDQAGVRPVGALEPGLRAQATAIGKGGSRVPVSMSVATYHAGSKRRFLVVLRDLSEIVNARRLRDQMVWSLGHELRTPLTALRGALALVAGGSAGMLPASAQPLLAIAQRNGEKLVALIDGLLDVDRMRSGVGKALNLAMVDLSEIATRAIREASAAADQRGIPLRLADWPDAALVRGDGERLLQVVANLLSNAIKFSPRGGLVEVSITERGPWLRLSVADCGPGVPDEFRKLVFHCFAQADGRDDRPNGGAGMGLAVVQSIIEAHRGHVGFDSVPGDGATFWFELLRPDADLRDDENGSRAA